MLASALKIARPLMCAYCGTETPAIGGAAVCSNCECIAYMDREALQAKDPQLFSDLQEMNSRLGSSDYSGAVSVYDRMISTHKDPSYLYAKALVCIKHSNYGISNIRYDRVGFMEENTALRDAARDLELAAKQFLNSAVAAAAPDMELDKPPLGSSYAAFLSHIKLSDLRAAKYAMECINRVDSGYVGEYAQMVLESNLKRPDSAIRHAEALARPERFSINAFFYLAMALYDKGRYREAKSLAERLKTAIGNSSVDVLLHEIGQQLVI